LDGGGEPLEEAEVRIDRMAFLVDVPPFFEHVAYEIEVRLEALGVGPCIVNDSRLQGSWKSAEQLLQIMPARSLSDLVQRESLEPEFDTQGLADKGRHEEKPKATIARHG
jgi:hypothetical protein